MIGYKGITNYKLQGVYVAKIIGCTNSTIHFFFFGKNSLSLNMFSTREDSTVKKIRKRLQEGAFGKKMIT